VVDLLIRYENNFCTYEVMVKIINAPRKHILALKNMDFIQKIIVQKQYKLNLSNFILTFSSLFQAPFKNVQLFLWNISPKSPKNVCKVTICKSVSWSVMSNF
jgi:hypothetical protein